MWRIFTCASAGLVSEIDGFAHDTDDRPARDEERDRFLRERGLRVARMPASEVLRDADEAVRVIVEMCRAE